MRAAGGAAASQDIGAYSGSHGFDPCRERLILAARVA